MTETQSDDQSREVFRALVETQDSGMSVQDSRDEIGRRFDLSREEVLEIERAGIAAQWPPL